MEKLIITVAVTGAEVTKQQQPNLPVTPDEIAQEVYRCWQAGASIAHIHARMPDGTPTQSKEVYAEIKKKIQEKCDIIIQFSTGGAVWHKPEERIQCLDALPEMATLSAGSCNFGDDVFMNSPSFMELLAKRMKELGIRPEIEVFEPGMIENALRLVKKGLLELPLHFDFVLGVPGAMTGNIEDLVFLVHKLPAGCTWSVAGIGRYELPLAVHSILMGGHVRVGFEDNIYYRKGELATSNAQLVERVVRIAKEVGREIATPQEARKILGITK
ncbi:MAG: 3-keto-5-aminohexanoate cleavage protein [Fervidobacterium sp.]|uniref:3-keto-5-aminohexanoate cleavage enzyme n=1 Tax=Fervidobacterium gondwanense DSM 13020 TaxID=1121883 RepID=A0A1M7SZ44_FERGO|nr:3-keto-5-aminohexanoate cleavage protein [Fervidobacterium gondwanense]UXF01058.1 3-keto-5-aminohexanoate cleavage protein [Fervidobacterium riparium]SHN63681.1 3-keto-5-aminohexanoate cleavage enzyme [Fervidobacterium gondwanense DSM 13020]